MQPTDRDALVDELVPAPWSATRRAVFTACVAALVGVAVGLWWLGALGPNLAPITGAAWGPQEPGDDTVEVQLALHNRGALAIDRLEVSPPELWGAEVTVAAAPRTLAPGQERDVELRLRVTDCDAFRAPRDDPGLEVRARSGVVTRTTVARYQRGLTGPVTWHDGYAPASVWNGFAASVCDPEQTTPGA